MRRIFLVAVPVILLLGAVTWTVLALGGPYNVPWSTVDGGGGESAGGSYALKGTAGQPEAGSKLVGGSYGLTGGFGPGVAGGPPPSAAKAVASLRTAVDVWLPENDSAAGVAIGIPQVVDASTGLPLPNVLLGAYAASLTYPPDPPLPPDFIAVLGCRLKPPFETGACNTSGDPNGIVILSGLAPQGAPWPVDPLAFVPLRLLGCVQNVGTVTLTFSQVVDVNGDPLDPGPPVVRTFRRGDAKPDGVVAISDVLYIRQYLVGLRPLGDGPGQVNAVNAASVKQDGAFDKITTADVLYLAQLLVGMRDGCFSLLPAAEPPER